MSRTEAVKYTAENLEIILSFHITEMLYSFLSDEMDASRFNPNVIKIEKQNVYFRDEDRFIQQEPLSNALATLRVTVRRRGTSVNDPLERNLVARG